MKQPSKQETEKAMKILQKRMKNILRKSFEFKEFQAYDFEVESSPLMDEFIRINALIYRLKMGESPQEILLEMLSDG